MALPQPVPKVMEPISVEEYLRMERASDGKHEYRDGQIFAMAGESPKHGDVSFNVVGLFYNQLKGTPCRARTKDTKVRSGPVLTAGQTSRVQFSYPDVVVICGEPEYLDDQEDIVLNPKALVEVLSPATEAFDRGGKFHRYQTWNPTLTDYVLVSQDQPLIEHFCKQADGSWSYRRYAGLESSLTIASIGVTLNLADVYERVQFPSTEES